MPPLAWLVVALVAGAAGYLLAWPAWQSYRSRDSRDLNAERYLAWRGRAVRGQAPRVREGMTGEERRRIYLGAALGVVGLLALFAFFWNELTRVMRVELLYADGDPAAMLARQNLVEVLTEDAFETPIQMIAVASEADAGLLGMRGSPMIRIDGDDIDPDWNGPIGLAERSYGDARIPSKPLLRRAVERARGWSHGRPPRRGED